MIDLKSSMLYLLTLVVAIILIASIMPIALDNIYGERGTEIETSSVIDINIHPLGLVEVDRFYLPSGDVTEVNVTGSVAVIGITPMTLTYDIIVNGVVATTTTLTATGTHTFDHDISAFLDDGAVNIISISTTANTNITTVLYDHTVSGVVGWPAGVMGLWTLVPILAILGIVIFFVYQITRRFGGG